ncbi:hypothetical protein [Hymenobacter sp. B1770]|uniref:hypothetical protein n=1 Tax=Hymenobacter sp. B1770 TaxID=1718788 RepID=UPI003CFBB6E7
MRDTNEGMVELLDALRENGFYGCKASITLGNEKVKVKFGTNERGWIMLKKLLSFQPFENVSFGKYRYYFTSSYRQNGEDVLAGIRVEQGQRHKRFELELTKELNANLIWLILRKDKTEVAHLIIEVD